jgi:hypothetical protein
LRISKHAIDTAGGCGHQFHDHADIRAIRYADSDFESNKPSRKMSVDHLVRDQVLIGDEVFSAALVTMET